MSRLNLIKPEHLTNIHLVAEYKEITQFLHLIRRRIDNGKSFHDIPKEYTLNGGHCLFFYNKGEYIYKRFKDLYSEMKNRNMNCCDDKYKSRIDKIIYSFSDREDLIKDYEPDRNAYAVAIERIKFRIETKPHMYKDSDRFFKNINVYLD